MGKKEKTSWEDFLRRERLCKKISTLSVALRDLVDCQNGPPLLDKRHRDEWEAAMERARQALLLAEEVL